MHAPVLKNEKALVLESVHDERARGVFMLLPPLKRLVPYALQASAVAGAVKLAMLWLLALLGRKGERAEYFRGRAAAYRASLRMLPIMRELFR